jgi:hypothetical protein
MNRVPQFCTGDEIKKNMRRERRRRGTIWVSHLNWSSRSLTHSFGFAFPAPSLLLIGRYSSLNQVFLESNWVWLTQHTSMIEKHTS